MLLVLSVFMVSSAVLPAASGQALPESELRSLNVNPNWVGNCGTTADGSVTPTDTSAPPITPGAVTITGHITNGAPGKDSTIHVGDAFKGPGSTFGNDPKTGYIDPNAGSAVALSGGSLANPGIAVYTDSSLGGWWKIVAPDGKGAILQQIDYGPSASGPRGRRIVDIDSVAARSVFALPEGNAFPTDQGNWTIQYMGKTQPPGAITKDNGGTGSATPTATTSSSGQASCCDASLTSVTAGAGAPDGTTFPNLDPTAMANAIDKWVVQQNANTTLKGLGATMVASAKNSNISPFLLATIPKEESAMADPGDFNVSHGNNAYGRSAAPGQPSFQGSRAWYKWTSMKASVDYTAPENKGTNVGDMASFLRNSGSYTKALDSNDLTTFFNVYAPATDGNNTVGYIANIKSWISQLVALAGNPTATVSNTTLGATATSSNSSSCCPPSDGSSTTNTTAPTSATAPHFIDLSGPPTNASQLVGAGPFSGKPNVLLIHYVQGPQEGADLAKNVLKPQGYGVQFNIGLSGKVYQYFPLNNMQLAWQAYHISTHAIGIEITGADGDALLNNAQQFSSVVNTVKYLCGYYNIPCSSPKGDITHDTEPNSQGLLGHSEAPLNDHSDPDTKVIGQASFEIPSGKPWTTADRYNSSIHPYMVKLRTALGYDPTPGSSGTPVTPPSTGTTGNSCPATGSTATTTGLVWPFAKKSSSQYNRVDQGWDIQGKSGENIYAISPGTLYKLNKDTGMFGDDYPTEKLDTTIGGPSDWLYYGHVHILANLIGKHVNSGQLIAHANTFDGENGSGAPPGWLEIGFAQPTTDAPLDGPPFPTAAGAKMKSILISAQPGPGGN